MRHKRYVKSISTIVILLAFLTSCNTYKWQRKRYYKSNKVKNWNNYNNQKAKEELDKELDKYYKKY